MTYSQPQSRADFQIALVSTLQAEADALLNTEVIFDEIWDDPGFELQVTEDDNVYNIGRIGRQNVVLICIRQGKLGSASGAVHLYRSFENITLTLVVGVCGAVSSYRNVYGQQDIYLGDLVISTAIVQYDFGRQENHVYNVKQETENSVARAGNKVASALKSLQLRYNRVKFESQISDVLRHFDEKPLGFKCPERTKSHENEASNLDPATKHQFSCNKPCAIFGRYGSADTVMKSQNIRDEIAREHGVIAFEMEGVGVWSKDRPCIVMKSVSNYADDQKAEQWQARGSAVAAAAVKVFLERWITTKGSETGWCSPSMTPKA